MQRELNGESSRDLRCEMTEILKTLQFCSDLPLEVIVEAFRDEFGDFDRTYEGKNEWKDSLVFA